MKKSGKIPVGESVTIFSKLVRLVETHNLSIEIIDLTLDLYSENSSVLWYFQFFTRLHSI